MSHSIPRKELSVDLSTENHTQIFKIPEKKYYGTIKTQAPAPI